MPFRLARHAMATRFEVVLPGADPVRLRAIAEEALDEIDRIENLLSRYRPHTDIGRINRHGAESAVRITPETFLLLQRARELSRLTDGAFDPTAGSLIEAWGFIGGTGRTPDPLQLEQARSGVGWQQVELNDQEFTVRFLRPGMSLDLGAIGKGYGLDRAATLIREAGVTSALFHGGTSTVVAIGAPPDQAGWKVALSSAPGPQANPPGIPHDVLLRDEALSVSAPWGKSFVDESGCQRGHVLDPRTGQPTATMGLAAVVAPSGADSDALSTALLVGGMEVAQRIQARPGIRLWSGTR